MIIGIRQKCIVLAEVCGAPTVGMYETARPAAHRLSSRAAGSVADRRLRRRRDGRVGHPHNVGKFGQVGP